MTSKNKFHNLVQNAVADAGESAGDNENFDLIRVQTETSSIKAANSEGFYKKKIGKNEYTFKRIIIPAIDVKNLVMSHPLNPRVQALLNKVSVGNLIRQISKSGAIQTPAVCLFDGEDGKYYALDGSRRKFSAVELGMDLPVEFSTDEISEEDIKLYIQSTDTSEKWSVFEKIKKVEGEYFAFVDAWRDENAFATWNDRLFVEVSEDINSVSNLSAYKKIWTELDYDIFASGDANKFTQADLTSFATLVRKLRVNNKNELDKVTNAINGAFEYVSDQFVDEWTPKMYFEALSAQLGIKSPKNPATEKNDLCVITDGEGEEFTVTYQQTPKGFRVNIPTKITNEDLLEKLKVFLIAELDN
ncbi:hypothetical protein [Photobacterium kishitanii]|uniref:ParB/Sulfiredoxin domain-containing protein n=1 Tax=Photobacterium kishitanii TaxID=318456 RepID=A0A2T3KN16_9GAMM|nr:hypothetical protein [Photobacterium kishitanii]PSV01164.1 hypothetical protein C9J27_03835 [Photobacterium kishitanii]